MGMAFLCIDQTAFLGSANLALRGEKERPSFSAFTFFWGKKDMSALSVDILKWEELKCGKELGERTWERV
jgi:hypothetical protein